MNKGWIRYLNRIKRQHVQGRLKTERDEACDILVGYQYWLITEDGKCVTTLRGRLSAALHIQKCYLIRMEDLRLVWRHLRAHEKKHQPKEKHF